VGRSQAVCEVSTRRMGGGLLLLLFFGNTFFCAVDTMAYYGSAYSTAETIDNTKHYAKYVLDNNILGVLVECGIAAGSQMAAMRDAIGETRTIYGFDSFEGIPLASKEDDEQPGMSKKPVYEYSNDRELLKSSGITVHPYDAVVSQFKRWFNNRISTLVFVKGWFQDTLPVYANVIGPISLLRLDGDLYLSTKVCLDYLFPKLSVGGILIIDDWNLGGCRRACGEYFETHPVKEIIPPFDGKGPKYFIKTTETTPSNSGHEASLTR